MDKDPIATLLSSTLLVAAFVVCSSQVQARPNGPHRVIDSSAVIAQLRADRRIQASAVKAREIFSVTAGAKADSRVSELGFKIGGDRREECGVDRVGFDERAYLSETGSSMERIGTKYCSSRRAESRSLAPLAS